MNYYGEYKENRFFYHWAAFAILFLGTVIGGLLITGIIELWKMGSMVFLGWGVGILITGVATHILAKYLAKKEF